MTTKQQICDNPEVNAKFGSLEHKGIWCDVCGARTDECICPKPVERITINDMAQELWSIAQQRPREGKLEGVNRIIKYLEANQKKSK